MTYYVAIVEDGGLMPRSASGSPTCPAASRLATTSKALKNAEEALLLYAEEIMKTGRSLPKPRSVVELKQDPQARADMKKYVIALVPFRQHDVHAAG